MDTVHFDPAGRQLAQQDLDFAMPVGVRGEQLNEPAVVWQFLQPDASRFKSGKGERPGLRCG